MPRKRKLKKLKIRLRTCCESSSTIRYAVPDSKSIEKLRSRFVQQTGKFSLKLIICHVPIGIKRGYFPITKDYISGDWEAVIRYYNYI
jgi:hypothetical protein